MDMSNWLAAPRNESGFDPSISSEEYFAGAADVPLQQSQNGHT